MKYPALRILIPFLTGIIFYMEIYPRFGFSFLIMVFSLIVLILLLIVLKKNKSISYIFVNAALASAGFILSYNYDIANNKNYFLKHISSSENIIADIIEPVENRDGYLRTIIRIKYTGIQTEYKKVKGKCILYINGAGQELKFGDRIMFPAKNIQPISYSYYKIKNIHTKTALFEDDIKLISRNNGSIIRKCSFQTREKFIEILRQNNVHGDELATASSLLFGYKHLSEHIYTNYKNAGVIHILCVSGLNVGIVYVLLSHLFYFFKRYRLLYLLLILTGIWFYAFVCGLSPSILRASAMFSFIIAGSIILRKAIPVNYLLISAFLLLIINPFLLYEHGFLLSYLSVLGILIIHPQIYKLLQPENPLVKLIWVSISVSLSVQLMIFPLLTYYSGNFPTYFLIANLIIIPLAFVLTYTGTAIILIYPLFISSFLSWIFIALIKFMNHYVYSVNLIPLSLLTDINLKFLQVLMLYFLIGFLIYIHKKREILVTSGYLSK